MGVGYLLDTNVIIDYLDNKLPLESSSFIDENSVQFSVISRIELLSWPMLTDTQLQIIESFIASSIIWNLDDSIIIKASELRRMNKKVKLPDAIIAATALVNNFVLITRNIADFKNVQGLNIIDLYKQ